MAVPFASIAMPPATIATMTMLAAMRRRRAIRIAAMPIVAKTPAASGGSSVMTSPRMIDYVAAAWTVTPGSG
jgi:hypothetical protein